MSDKDIRQHIEGLKNFRARSRCVREILAAGEEAVDPLLEALNKVSQEGARWAVLRCLGELRAQKAVGHIAPLLEDRRYRTGVHDALVKIVGEDLGPVAQPWLRWAQEAGAGGAGVATFEPQMHMTGLPDERLIELALKGCSADRRQEAEGRYDITVPLGGSGESQEVSVNLTQKDHEGSPIVIVYADCGPAKEQHYEHALQRNLRMPYGALAVRGSGENARFVMFNTLLREDMSPLELRKSILAIAERAARMRRDLEEESDDQAQGPEL